MVPLLVAFLHAAADKRLVAIVVTFSDEPPRRKQRGIMNMLTRRTFSTPQAAGNQTQRDSNPNQAVGSTPLEASIDRRHSENELFDR